MISPREIEDRLEDEATTLRRMPHPAGPGPKGYGSSWPPVVQEARHAYGDHATRMRVVPSARDIARMEEAITWLALIADPVDRRIVWMRAENHRWRQVCITAGCARSTANRRWAAALLTIANHLKNNEKAAQRKAAAKRRDEEASRQRTETTRPTPR